MPFPPGSQMPQADFSTADADSASGATARLTLQGLTLLIVDDSRFACDALRLILQLWGFVRAFVLGLDRPAAVPQRADYPEVFNLQLVKTQDMRYGENPHQSAAFYRDAAPVAGTLSGWTQLQGKALSAKTKKLRSRIRSDD